MKNKNLIIMGEMQAKCACGGWHYQGIMPEARLAIEAVYQSHLWSCSAEKGGKKKKK